jgi:SAM-dependent methyltransferase
LARERYKGRFVLEIGCGFGCNLFSLAGVEGRFVGVEPVALYRQFTALLAEREQIAPPEIVDGAGESLPFADDEFDIVLCCSSHQYMDIKRALQEMARVLRPGGQLQIVGGTLGSYGIYALREVISNRRVGSVKAHGLTIGNTLAYCVLGRRLYTPKGLAATTAPIYPPRFFMDHWLRRAGLTVRSDLSRRVSGEACFIADAPTPNSIN